jgi:hypothetical protein
MLNKMKSFLGSNSACPLVYRPDTRRTCVYQHDLDPQLWPASLSISTHIAYGRHQLAHTQEMNEIYLQRGEVRVVRLRRQLLDRPRELVEVLLPGRQHCAPVDP